MRTLVKVVAGLFLFLFFGTILLAGLLALFIDDDTRQAVHDRQDARQAIRDRQEAKQLAKQNAETPPDRDDKADGGDTPAKPESPPKPKPFVMPSYTVLDTMKRLDGNVQVEVLVPTLSRSSPLDMLEKVASKAAGKEEADILLLFATKAAQKAAYSDSFKRQNPAAAKGYLGRWTKDGFEEGGQ